MFSASLASRRKPWNKLGFYGLPAVQINQQKLYTNGWFTMALLSSCSVNKPTEVMCKRVVHCGFGLMLLDTDTESTHKGLLFSSQRKGLIISSCHELLNFPKTITLDLSPMLVF